MSFRDDHDALRAYHDSLTRELAHLEPRAEALAAVEAERAQLAAELARVRADLAHHRIRRAPIRLDTLRIASPCSEPWETMVGDDRVRDCARCAKPVFDLSALTTAQAEALLATKGITACVQFYRRADGMVMTADCPVGLRKKRSRLALAAGLLAGAAGAAGVAATHRQADHAVCAAPIEPIAGTDRPATERMVQRDPMPPPPITPGTDDRVRGRVSYVPAVTEGDFSVLGASTK
jgi:hypothetical protein